MRNVSVAGPASERLVRVHRLTVFSDFRGGSATGKVDALDEDCFLLGLLRSLVLLGRRTGLDGGNVIMKVTCFIC